MKLSVSSSSGLFCFSIGFFLFCLCSMGTVMFVAGSTGVPLSTIQSYIGANPTPSTPTALRVLKNYQNTHFRSFRSDEDYKTNLNSFLRRRVGVEAPEQLKADSFAVALKDFINNQDPVFRQGSNNNY